MLWSRWGGALQLNFFNFLYVEQQKQGFQPKYFNRYLSNEKNTFADNLIVEPTIFWVEKLSGFFFFFFTFLGPYANKFVV